MAAIYKITFKMPRFFKMNLKFILISLYTQAARLDVDWLTDKHKRIASKKAPHQYVLG